MLAAARQSYGCLLLLTQLIEPPRGAHADFDGVGFEVLVLGLPRIDGHRYRYIADVLRFVRGARLGDGAATALIEAVRREVGRKVAAGRVAINVFGLAARALGIARVRRHGGHRKEFVSGGKSPLRSMRALRRVCRTKSLILLDGGITCAPTIVFFVSFQVVTRARFQAGFFPIENAAEKFRVLDGVSAICRARWLGQLKPAPSVVDGRPLARLGSYRASPTQLSGLRSWSSDRDTGGGLYGRRAHLTLLD